MQCNRNGPVNTARTLLAAIMTAAGVVLAPHASAHWPSSTLVAVEVVDRTAGTTLSVYAKDDGRYVVGTPGHEYAVRITNNTGARILAVTSVDGVNVVSGETASPDQSGYVIEAGDNVEIAGWRRSLERTAAFYFTDLGDSYAARTGRPADVGVIGVAVFRERAPIISYRQNRDRIAAETPGRERGDAPASPMMSPQADDARNALEAGASSGNLAADSARLASKLGTGFGREESSLAQRVRFERATSSPAQTVAIRYDRRENLIAMRVLPSPRYAQRVPDPFPAMRFAPAPR